MSLTGYFQFIVHKNHRRSKMPYMETPTHYVFLGMNNSIDEAIRQATEQAVDFLQKKAGLDFYDAYALASTTVDFTVARALVPRRWSIASSPSRCSRPRRRTGTRALCPPSTEPIQPTGQST